MKIDAMSGLAVGFAAFAAYYVLKPKGTAGAQTAADQMFGLARAQRQDVGANLWQSTYNVSEIFNAAGLPFENDWRYYSDGTSISPEGKYYKDGKLVWSPTA